MQRGPRRLAQGSLGFLPWTQWTGVAGGGGQGGGQMSLAGLGQGDRAWLEPPGNSPLFPLPLPCPPPLCIDNKHRGDPPTPLFTVNSLSKLDPAGLNWANSALATPPCAYKSAGGDQPVPPRCHPVSA